MDRARTRQGSQIASLLLLLAPGLALAQEQPTGETAQDPPADADDSADEAAAPAEGADATGAADEASGSGEGTEAGDESALVPPPMPGPPYRSLLVDTAPVLIDALPPSYPEQALEQRIDGVVLVELSIDDVGVVTDATVFRGLGAGLDEAAVEAAYESFFDPATLDGAPVPVVGFKLPIRFELPEELRPPPPEGEMASELSVFPELLEFVNAPYPDEALAAGLEASVPLSILVDETGQVEAVRLAEGPVGWGFDEAAADAAWQFQFSPAYAGENFPVAVEIAYTYNFELSEEQLEALAQRALEGQGGEAGEGEGPAEPLVDLTGPISLEGTVRVRGTRELMPDIEVYIEELEHSVFTDQNGRFEFRGLPPGTWTVVITQAGFDRFETEEDVITGEAAEVVYYVRELQPGSFTTTVRVQQERREVARRTVELAEIRQVPGTFGDPLKVVQLLPGVSRAAFDVGILIIRGSAPEDSGVYVDGIRVPQLYHFGGLRSVINQELFSAIDFYPGGFGGAWGRSTGGVIDVRTRTDFGTTPRATVQIDLIDASIYGMTPIRRKRDREVIGGVALSVRRSYLDLLIPLLSPPQVDLSQFVLPRWWDYQGKFRIRTGDGPKAGDFSLFVYGSDDRLGATLDDPASDDVQSLRGEFGLVTIFHRVNLGYSWESSNWAKHSFDFSWGLDRTVTEAGQFLTAFGEIQTVQLRHETVLERFEGAALALGADFIYTSGRYDLQLGDIDLGSFGDNPNAEGEAFALDDRLDAIAPALYVEGRFTLLDERLLLTPTLRFDYYVVPGEFDFATLDPRFSFQAILAERFQPTIKGSIGVYHQNPQAFELIEGIGGNSELGPEESPQVTLAFELWPTDYLNFEIQGYYKRLLNLATFSTGFDPGAGTGQDFFTDSGDGHIYGFEIFLRHFRHRNFFGWVSYTFQRSLRRDAPELEYYPYDFDQPHILNVVASYQLPAGFSIGATFRLVSGNPETPVIGAYYDVDSNDYFPLSGETNSERLPLFHQLDIRIDKTFQLRRWQFQVYLDIRNVYNRRNPEFTRYNFDYTERAYLNSVPFLPNIGIKAEF